MNYRHAYHAGNFADCVKHALLVALLDALRRKPAPFAVLDTHAGAGFYDLEGEEARRTGEWRGGIGRVTAASPKSAALVRYREVVQALGLYPGSPAIAAALLRDDDRLICCELHPDDAARLRRRFRDDKRVSVHERDGYEAVRALLPPAQKRGLLLIDPPYERADDGERAVAAIAETRRRFPAATVACWYPVKGLAEAHALRGGLQAAGVRDVVDCRFLLRAPEDATRLNGCGVAVANPPFGFETDAEAILRALLAALGTGERGAGVAASRWADE